MKVESLQLWIHLVLPFTAFALAQIPDLDRKLCGAMSEWIPYDEIQEEEARLELATWPLDEFNARTLNEVHPRNYFQSTSEPHEIYDLIAIGSGAGGLVSSKKKCLTAQALHFQDTHLFLLVFFHPIHTTRQTNSSSWWEICADKCTLGRW
jgi:hypothetical protein